MEYDNVFKEDLARKKFERSFKTLHVCVQPLKKHSRDQNQ